MAVTNEDLARLVVRLEATTTQYYNALKKAQQQTNTSANAIEKRLTNMSSRIDKTFANLGQRLSANLTGPLAGIGAAFSIREILQYADAWTEAGNQIRASSDITGLQARGLEELRKLADDSRAGFEETVKLYTRMQRAASGVANSEEEIARATTIVNRAFKAGGAATSEMHAGIIQLSQGLASGLLQGDELRSVRENAPVLAKVIADYFGVTVAGLKELGAEGKLTSDLVFKAILSGEAQIQSAFATTQATISDGFTKVRNALIQYVGTADQSAGATAALNAGLNALADNFSTVADITLKLAALIAGALVGRSLIAMTGSVIAGAKAIRLLTVAMASASAGGAGFATVLKAAGLAAGPIATILGGVALFALQELASQSLESSQSINKTIESLESLGVTNVETAAQIREAAQATDELTESQRKLREEESKRSYQRAVVNEEDLRGGTFADNLTATTPVFATDTSQLSSAFAIANRAASELDSVFANLNESERESIERIRELALALQNSTIPARSVSEELKKMQEQPLTDRALELLDVLDNIAIKISQVELAQIVNGGSQELDFYTNKLVNALEIQADLAQSRTNFASEDEKIAFTSRLDELITKLKEGSASAEYVQSEIAALSSMNPSFGGIIAGLGGLISSFMTAALQALNLKRITDSLSTNSNVPTGGMVGQDNAAIQAVAALNREKTEAGQVYLDQQNELLTKTEAERDLIEEIARIRKEMGDEAQLSEEQITTLATQRLAQNQSDKGGSASEKDAKKFFEDIKNAERANELLNEELALRASLNPLIEDYGYALERAKKEQELLNAAEDAGIALTPQLEEKIRLIAEAYASGTAALEKLQEAQDKTKQQMQEWFDLAKSMTRSFIDDLIAGKTATEALGNALQQLGSYLIDAGLNSLFGGAGGGGGTGGILGGLLSSLFTPRAGGGPVTKGQSYIVGEKRPEVFVPNQNGVIIPRVPTNMGSSSGTQVPISIQIDATGADKDGMMRLTQELVKLKAEIPYMVKQQVSNRSKKGW